MNQEFNLRFDEIKQNDLTNREKPPTAVQNQFDDKSHVRNLCFTWPDNKKQFFSYSYLISAQYLPDDSSITLFFSTHSVFIKGTNLESLYDDFTGHLPRNVVCLGDRYKHLLDDDEPAIETITIHSNS